MAADDRFALLRKKPPLFFEGVILAISCIFLEFAFKASTTQAWGFLSTVAIAFFALSLAGLIYALALLPKRHRYASALIVACLSLLGVLYSVEYFIFRQFKVFYDLNTVLFGAGDAATGFTGQILSLVFSFGGLLHIAVFLAPAIVYGVLAWRAFLAARRKAAPKGAHAQEAAGKSDDGNGASGRGAHFAAPAEGSKAKSSHKKGAHIKAGSVTEESSGPSSRPAISFAEHIKRRASFIGAGVAICLLSWLIGWGIIMSNPAMRASYTDRYDFQQVVSNAGLVQGVRKEIVRMVTGEQSNVTFKTVEFDHPIVEPDSEEATGDGDAAEIDYGYSQMNIDFPALAASTSGTWADLDGYVAGLTPSKKNAYTGLFAGKNLIFISAEAFSAEAIREDTTPTLYRMATKGMQFLDYYQFDSAGTTGGECQNIFGMVPTEGGYSVKITADHNNYFTMGNALNRMGYNGWAFHNNTYTYYNRHLTHVNLGYCNGYMGYGNGMEQWVTWQWPQSDLEMIQGTFENLYGNAAPFNVYYMSVSGHSGYYANENAMSQKNWDAVAGLPYSEPVLGYLACNVELDRAMEWLISALEQRGIADDTVIVIAADHFPYGLDDDGPLGRMPFTSELYGYSVDTYFQRDHNRLIIWSKSLESSDPIVVSEPTMSTDILPTLLNLFGCEWDSRLLPGRDVFSDAPALVFDPSYDWKTSLGTYYASAGSFVQAEGAEVPEGYVEWMNTVVSNKMNYCKGVLTTDYYRHVFGDPEDIWAANERGKAENAVLFGSTRLHAAAAHVNAMLSGQFGQLQE